VLPLNFRRTGGTRGRDWFPSVHLSKALLNGVQNWMSDNLGNQPLLSPKKYRTLIFLIMMGHMPKISHFWAKMKKDPKCQLGRFCPEPFKCCMYPEYQSIPTTCRGFSPSTLLSSLMKTDSFQYLQDPIYNIILY